MMPPLPATLVPALPFVSLIATDWLRHSTLPKWANTLIALFVPVFVALVWALIAKAFTANIGADLVIVVSLSYAVMALPDLAGLRGWLQETLDSPLAGLIVDGSATVGPTTPITPITPAEPTALVLPATPPSLRRSAAITSGGVTSKAAPTIAPGSLHGITAKGVNIFSESTPPTLLSSSHNDDEPGDPVPV